MNNKVNEILSSRGKEYGDRFVNLECIAEFKAVYHKYAAGRPMGSMTNIRRAAFDHAMEMVLLKIARICTGTYKEDNFLDCAGYLELAHSMLMGNER